VASPSPWHHGPSPDFNSAAKARLVCPPINSASCSTRSRRCTTGRLRGGSGPPGICTREPRSSYERSFLHNFELWTESLRTTRVLGRSWPEVAGSDRPRLDYIRACTDLAAATSEIAVAEPAAAVDTAGPSASPEAVLRIVVFLWCIAVVCAAFWHDLPDEMRPRWGQCSQSAPQATPPLLGEESSREK
jgi:hypothetical protein